MTPVHLRLYVTGHTVSAKHARAALSEIERRVSARWGRGAVITEIIDVLESPEMAAEDQVFATPTLIRIAPAPTIRLFGDLSSPTKLMAGLQLAPARAARSKPPAQKAVGPVAPRRRNAEDGACRPFTHPSATSSLPAAARE
jgi:circadian clock protein KaiB